MNLLSAEEIQSELAKLPPEWTVVNSQLTRVYEFDDFYSALKFVNKVGKAAENINHHPDIHFGWGKVELFISTHSAGGITAKDFKLAQSLEKL